MVEGYSLRENVVTSYVSGVTRFGVQYMGIELIMGHLRKAKDSLNHHNKRIKYHFPPFYREGT